MKVRTKFTLWISLTALSTAVIFSMAVYFELLDESYDAIDKELNTVAGAIFGHLDLSEPGKARKLHSQYDYLIERYWVKILDSQGRTLFASPLTRKFDIPFHPRKARYFIKKKMPLTALWVDPEDIDELNEITDDTVKFRVRSLSKSRSEDNYTILIAKPLLFLDLELRELVTGLTSGIIAAVVLIFLASYYLAGRLLKPIVTINQDIREIRESSLDRRIVVGRSRDELHTLAHSLNSMFDRLQHSFSLQREFIGNAAHELKSPLTILMLGHEEMLAASPPESIGRELEKQLHTLRRLSKLIRDLLEISRLEKEDICVREPIGIDKLITRVLDDYREILKAKNITVETDIIETVMSGDPEKLQRLLINLIDNAIKYNFEGAGTIKIATGRNRTMMTLTITNTGLEIPANDLPRIFDQFYRVEKSRSQSFGGAGLGLTIVRRIVELHGGNINVTSSDGLTTCTVSLP
ncbi:MAG: HAMP domain-containing protein [Proteobacteria bacterium]|nr:HAMP domain-containing protein [Pseudomonadota bacterium]